MSGYKRVNFYDLCRLCATHHQRDKIHIFEEKGRKIQLQDKIHTCLSLQVCENDFLPKVVCANCLENLEKSCIFRQECYNSETMLVSYFNNFRHTEEFKKSGKVYIKDVSQKNVTDVEVEQSSVTMATASTNTDCNSVNVIPNILPQEILSSFYTLQIPQVSSLTTTPVIQQTVPTSLVHDAPKIVSHQPQVFYNSNNNKPILKTNTGASATAISIRVNSNGEIIGTTPIIDLNTYTTKRKLPPDNANVMKIDLTTEPDKLNHSLVFNQVQNNFNRSTNITNMNVISVPYASVVVNPTQNESQPPPPPQHSPPLLPTYTTDVYNPPPEQTIENNEKPPKLFSCTICGKNFKKREHLYQHVKLHSGFRPYKCENCNKTYIRKEHLMRHLTAHNGEKKFMCEICERSFSRHDNLLKHKKTHEKVNYTCEICNRKFMLEHFFLMHKTSHEVKCGSIMGVS